MRRIYAGVTWTYKFAILTQNVCTFRYIASAICQAFIIRRIALDKPPIEPRIGTINGDPLVDNCSPIQSVIDVGIKA